MECTDAIDNIGTKVDLLKYCVQHNIQIFSSMGAGAKADPTRIQIADISETLYDPLARSVRQRLRASGITSGVPVVYSTEVPGEVGLLPLKEEEFEKGKVGELAAIDEFRVRILPVFGASLSRSCHTSTRSVVVHADSAFVRGIQDPYLRCSGYTQRRISSVT